MLILSGCNSESSQSVNPNQEQDGGLSPTSPELVYSSGWTEMVIRANSAKTTVDPGAHFATNRNACGKDAYGAIDLEDWNALAKYTNLAIEGESRPEDHCVDPPAEANKYMDGTVEVKTPSGIKVLFEVKDWQICTRIKDAQVSDTLLKTIEKIILQADKEDCPNGWGS